MRACRVLTVLDRTDGGSLIFSTLTTTARVRMSTRKQPARLAVKVMSLGNGCLTSTSMPSKIAILA
eukprot:scaffold11479_cov115-Isochrysis_galbana.AAC.2